MGQLGTLRKTISKMRRYKGEGDAGKNLGRHSIFYQWVISYALILTVSIVLCISIAISARDLLMEEYATGSASVRATTGRLLDSYLESVYAQQSQYVQSETLSQFLACNAPYSGADLYRLVDLQEQLRNYSFSAVGSTSGAYIYLHQLNKALSHSSIYDQALLMDVFHSDLAVDADALWQELLQHHGRDFVFLPTKDGGMSVLLMSSVPNSSLFAPQATVVQKLDDAFFEGLLHDSGSWMGMYMYLVDARGYIISASGPVEPVEELLASHSLDIDGQQNVALQGTEYLVSVDNSTVPKWYFVTLIAPEALNAKTSALNRITILMVLFTLCVGVSMSYILARRQYKPMAQVLRHLGSYGGQDAASNEYDFILSAFRNIKEAQHNIDAFWRQQTATLQKEFLTSALRGNIAGNVAHMAQALDLPVAGYGYFVLLINAYGAPVGMEATLDVVSEQCAAVAQAQQARVYCPNLREPRALVILLPEESMQSAYESICSGVLSIVDQEKWEVKLLAAPSPITRDINMLNLCYLDASFVLAEKYQRKSASAPLPPALNIGEIAQAENSDHTTMAICMAVRSGNAEAACERFAQMLARYPEQPEPSQHMLLTRLLADVLTTIPAAYRKEDLYKRLPDRLALRMRNATQLATIRQILQESIRMAAEVCAKERNSSLIDGIFACVDAHYAELDFNVSKVAQIMGMNTSYLSQYFRDQSGIGLLEYISRVRIKHAKALIQSEKGGLTIKQVAQQVGFENLNSFIRVFKKYEGVTPGEFRKEENGLFSR